MMSTTEAKINFGQNKFWPFGHRLFRQAPEKMRYMHSCDKRFCEKSSTYLQHLVSYNRNFFLVASDGLYYIVLRSKNIHANLDPSQDSSIGCISA